ncbi:MAG: hypothetical protein RLZZ89_534 [Cyanobacteriota bacterium]
MNSIFSFFLSVLLFVAIPSNEGAQLFGQHCVGCHLNGGNIIRRGKTLKLAALEKNGILSAADISAIAANGKGQMGAYGDVLGSAGINAVAEYVWQQALTNWPS